MWDMQDTLRGDRIEKEKRSAHCENIRGKLYFQRRSMLWNDMTGFGSLFYGTLSVTVLYNIDDRLRSEWW
jgi:hypothetical protein